MQKTKDLSTYRGDRKYRVKKQTLSAILGDNTVGQKTVSTLNQFERHLIQEGVKQILFCEGKEIINVYESADSSCYNSYQQMPKEMIQFLLDYDVIEEYFK